MAATKRITPNDRRARGGSAVARRFAILFWFYDNLNICLNRVQLLRRYNPGTEIYGLFGGASTDRLNFERALAPVLDDFWAYPGEHDSRWKWRNGDILIAEWFAWRGESLSWDTVVVAQWDMLIFAAVDQLFSHVVKDQILLSGLRPIREVEEWWYWVRGAEQDEYRRFVAHVRERYNFAAPPLCFLFVVACLPRIFLKQYAAIDRRDLGFLEYRMPIYAQIFRTTFCAAGSFRPWWPGDPATSNIPQRERVLNPGMETVEAKTILSELGRPDGARLFHPFREVFPVDLGPVC